MKVLTALATCCAAVLLHPEVARAGRPLTVDDTEPTAPGDLVLEVGIAADLGRADRAWSVPLCLAWGLPGGVELSVYTAPVLLDPPIDDGSALGLSDPGIGVKWKLPLSDASPVTVALAATATAPTARTGYGAGVATGDLMAIATHSSGGLSVDANLGYLLAAAGEGVDADGTFRGGVAVRYWVDDQVGFTGEVFGDDSEDTFSVRGVAAGAQLMATALLQLDAALGAGFVAGEARMQFTLGLTQTF